MDYGTITAVDEIGNNYEKQVSMYLVNAMLVVLIGNSRYRFNDLIKPKPTGFGDRFYLDVRGKDLNHNDSPVWCSNDELVNILIGKK